MADDATTDDAFDDEFDEREDDAELSAAERRDAELVARLVYEVPRQRHEEQREENRTLDTWLSTTRVVSAGMIALFVAALVLAGDSANEVLAQGEVRWSIIATAVLFICTFSASLVPYFMQAGAGWPDLARFVEGARESDSASLLWALGEHLATTTEANEAVIRRKARWVNFAGVLVTLTGISLAIAAVLAVAAG